MTAAGILVLNGATYDVVPRVAPPQPATGVQAKRIAELIEMFGVNTFSSLDTNNVWGSSPADYRPDSVLAALRYIVGDSGFALRLREYHYADRTDMQRAWLQTVTAAIPGTKAAICIGANGTAQMVPTMLSLANDPACNIAWVEGMNEPNTDFGQGMVPYSVTREIQEQVWNGGKPGTIMGPSIVAGTPHSEGWVEQYCGSQDNLDALNLLMNFGNGHYYPPMSPDVQNTGSSVNEYVGGLWTAWGHHDIMLPEFHPTLYNSQGHGPSQPGWDGMRDAYFTLCTLLRCAENGTRGLWWYALFDYGSVYRCGLFPQRHADNPRPAADALRALCAICADRGERHTFTPGLLDITVDPLPEAVSWDVYQASDGRFLVPIWYSAPQLGEGTDASVQIRFAARKGKVRIYEPLAGSEILEQHENVTDVFTHISPSVLVIEVIP